MVSKFQKEECQLINIRIFFILVFLMFYIYIHYDIYSSEIN
jgi:hypothetical protein